MPPVGSSQNRSHYQRAFRRHCHELLMMGYQGLDRGSFRDSEEPAITGELVRSMQEAQEAADAPDWVVYLAVRDDPPQNVEGRLGKRRRRIDIEIERCSRGRRPRFRFEAKRLHDSSSLSAYLGADGLMLFLSGSYAPDDDEVGMVGYVQTGAISSWSGKLRDRISANSEKYLLLPNGQLKATDLAQPVGECHESRHDRPLLHRTITVFHTFLMFHDDSSAAPIV